MNKNSGVRGLQGCRRSALLTALVGGVVLAGSAAPPAQAAREFSARYVPGVFVNCDVSHASRIDAPCAGGVNGIRVLPGEKHVRVRIQDDSGRRVQGGVFFHDRRGNSSAAPVRFCGDAHVRLPRGVATLTVSLGQGVGAVPQWADTCSGGDGARTGKVVAVFT